MAKKNREMHTIEFSRLDGSTTLFVAHILGHTPERIRLTEACWIASTGRMHKFFEGEPDGNAEWEPYPTDMVIDVFAPVFLAMPWPHDSKPFRDAR